MTVGRPSGEGTTALLVSGIPTVLQSKAIIAETLERAFGLSVANVIFSINCARLIKAWEEETLRRIVLKEVEGKGDQHLWKAPLLGCMSNCVSVHEGHVAAYTR